MAESVQRRFFFKLFGNISTGASTLLTQVMASRLLGVDIFGQFMFIQSHFEQLFGILDMGLSTTFFAQVSKSPARYLPTLALFVSFLGFGLCLIALYLGVSVWSGAARFLWPHVQPELMVGGFLFCLGVFLSRTVTLLPDAAGVAAKTETLRIARALGMLAVLLGLFFVGRFNLLSLFVAGALLYALFIYSTFRSGHRALGGGRPSFKLKDLGQGARDVSSFYVPMLIYSLFNIGTDLSERWLLQFVGGNREQGFFGIAVQFSLIIFLITQAMAPVFQREFGLAHAAQDGSRQKRLYCRHQNLFLAIAAIPSLFLFFRAEQFISLINGKEYLASWPVVCLLSLYPIHQTLGHLSLAALMARGRSATYMKIGFIRNTLGLALDYFLLAPKTWIVPGLELGAMGLAIKWLLSQWINTTLMQIANYRSLGLRYSRQLRREVLLIAILGLFSWLSQIRVIAGEAGIVNLVASAVIYLLAVGTLAWLMPKIFGLPKDLVSTLLNKILPWKEARA